MHIHGAGGADVMDAKPEALATISQTLIREGVTSFVAATMSASAAKIEHAINIAKNFKKQQEATATDANTQFSRAELLGLNLEGPFVSPLMAGAQKREVIIDPDLALLQKWVTLGAGIIRVVTLAPEPRFENDERGYAMVKYLREQKIVAAIGHSNATFAEAEIAIQAGCTHVIHVFNAMRALHHREPGLIAALLLHNSVKLEVIADGLHLHHAILQLILRCVGSDRIILVTDAMRAKGMPKGESELGGQKIIVTDRGARLEDGTLAGSVLTMPVAIANMMQATGCTLFDCMKMASANPAKQVGVFDRKGSIAVGKDADLIVLDEKQQLRICIAMGKIAFDNR
jgi:N-acetylglucosamine-6-phosphate deacetylase